jgi:hypothetical protein
MWRSRCDDCRPQIVLKFSSVTDRRVGRGMRFEFREGGAYLHACSYISSNFLPSYFVEQRCTIWCSYMVTYELLNGALYRILRGDAGNLLYPAPCRYSNWLLLWWESEQYCLSTRTRFHDVILNTKIRRVYCPEVLKADDGGGSGYDSKGVLHHCQVRRD